MSMECTCERRRPGSARRPCSRNGRQVARDEQSDSRDSDQDGGTQYLFIPLNLFKVTFGLCKQTQYWLDLDQGSILNSRISLYNYTEVS